MAMRRLRRRILAAMLLGLATAAPTAFAHAPDWDRAAAATADSEPWRPTEPLRAMPASTALAATPRASTGPPTDLDPFFALPASTVDPTGPGLELPGAGPTVPEYAPHDALLNTRYPFVADNRRAWDWRLFPDGLLYPGYLAGVREPRFSAHMFSEREQGWLFDGTVGARVGLLRYGSDDPVYPQGWQLDVEAAAMPRISLDEYLDLIATDFRYGFPLCFRHGPWELKTGFYHVSSHLGDEYILSGRSWHAGGRRFRRINFLRDALMLGVAVRPAEPIRLYAEAAWAFNTDGGAEPWEFQFGAEYSPYLPTGPRGAPFLAVNGHLREEVEFGGSLTVQAGWQWRLAHGRLVRFGFLYFNGMSEQYQFYNDHEEQCGFGVWYDF